MWWQKIVGVVITVLILLAIVSAIYQNNQSINQVDVYDDYSLEDFEETIINTPELTPDILDTIQPPTENPPVDNEVEQPPITQNACYVGGCSSHVCSDNPDVITTCEYREEYACYRTATCERQASGQCGWTETAELTQCLTGS